MPTTVMDYAFPTSAAVNKWYWSATDYSSAARPIDQLAYPYYREESGESFASVEPNPDGWGLWWDPNHVSPGFGWLNLLFVSWRDGADPNQPGAKNAWPAAYGDLRNAEVVFTCRVLDFYLRLPARIGLWLQTKDPVSDQYVNYFQSTDLIDSQLGYGGPGKPNATNGVHNSGWRECRVRLSTDDAMWTPMGTRSDRTGLPGGIVSPLGNYGCVPRIVDALGNWVTNMGIIIAWGNTPDTYTPPATNCPIKGKFQVKRVRLILPT